MLQSNQPEPVNFNQETISLREEFEKYVFHWKWFVLGVVLALLAAYIYLRYTPNVYQVSSTILIDDEAHGGLVSELSAFSDIGLMGGVKSDVENEIGILKSRSLMASVVKDLGLNVSYYRKGNVISTELFKEQSPIKLNFFNKDSLFYRSKATFNILLNAPTNFELSYVDENEELRSASYEFGENISLPIGNFTVTPTNLNDDYLGSELMVQILPLRAVVGNYQQSLIVDFVSKGSNILNISFTDNNRYKAEVLLNNLVHHYNKNAVEDKSTIANNTNKFISQRLQIIEKDLLDVDKGVELFKASNQLTDLPSEGALVMESNAALEQKIIDFNTQIKLANYVSEYLVNNKEELIPSNLGLADGSISNNTTIYNELILERNRILRSSSETNPIIVNLNAQINELRKSVMQGLINYQSSLSISLKDLQQQEALIHSKIIAVPNQERQYRDIQRQQQIIETLYLYLLQKREETSITLAVTLPNAKIIDLADGSDFPIAPKRKIIYLGALLLGLLVPFSIIYLLFLFDSKVHNRKDVLAMVKAPILGGIPWSKSPNKNVISENNRDSVSESFRLLRTNLNFMLTNAKDTCKTIFVTSTISGEGKTFVSINLASVLSLTNKKVLLIGADIRKPKLLEYLEIKNEKGLTHFLIDNNMKPHDIIEKVAGFNFDIIHSGIIAPNPSELLMNGRFEKILDYAKEHYDYVIVDTAPIQAVTDTLLLSNNQVDLYMYVIRANYLDKRMLETPKILFEEKRLPNMAVLINAVDAKKGYGYGYGYGYGVEEKPWWKKKFWS